MPLQRGFALIALLALAALISAFLIASALNLTSAGNAKEREDRSMSALRQAKAALIAHAANEQWQLYKALPQVPPNAYFQPGALPCPDQDDNGDANCTGSNTASMIGRVPYKTLGIDDLRDASGERLWYALSHDFRKMRCLPTPAPGCTRINSDTLGQLTVNGTAPATQVVAIVFAPGEAIQGQNRDPADTVAHNDPANYLENFSHPTETSYVFTTTALPSDTFNDRLLIITQADLMAAVEPVVAARIERDIKPLVQAYFNKWGAYPFPVPFGGGPPATQSAYQGVSTLAPPPPSFTHGLLPLKNDATFTWASAAVTQLVGHPQQTGPNPVVTSSSCTINSSPLRAVCQVNYSTTTADRPVIALEIFLDNANEVFADTPSGVTAPKNIAMVDNSGDPLVSDPDTSSNNGQWSFVSPPTPPTQQTFVARPNGGALTYIGRLQPAGNTGGRVTITVPLPSPAVNYLPIVSDNPGPPVVVSTPNPNPSGAWFIANQWYKQTYYAVSPGYAPGGVPLNTSATCSPLPVTPPTPPCLKVNNLPSPSDNKAVILVLAGRALNGSSRPSGIVNYLEGANLTAANDSPPYVYEHRAGAPTAINDRVVVVSP